MSDEPAAGEDAWLARALPAFMAHPAAGSAAVRVGPGDDAAVVRLVSGPDGSADLVATTDVLVDGRHFDLASCGPAAAARKALAVNLSDLAAMGARPTGFLVGAVLPQPADRALFDALMEGFALASASLGCPILGGDTNVADGPLVLAVTAFGQPGPAGVVTRAGGRAGDTLSVTGALGGSLRGRHLSFEPRVEAGAALAVSGHVHAMMDLSDGLARDLPRLCRASGVGAVVEAASVPLHADADGVRERAWLDGEDFELLVAHTPLSTEARDALAAAGCVLVPIGRLRAEAGCVLQTAAGAQPWPTGGWDHVGW